MHADIPSVKANSSHDPKTQLSEYEMISQIRLVLSLNFGLCRSLFNPPSPLSTLLLAGHETTSNAMNFMLWELAKHKHVQARLRGEIESVRAANGGSPLTADDLEHMPYLQAVVKVRRDR